jgi:hypothetical protein
MCKQLAEWLIKDKDPMMHSFTCTEHLSVMLAVRADTTEGIEPTSRGGSAGTTCDYLTLGEAVLEVIEIWMDELEGDTVPDIVQALIDAIKVVLQ